MKIILTLTLLCSPLWAQYGGDKSNVIPAGSNTVTLTQAGASGANCFSASTCNAGAFSGNLGAGHRVVACLMWTFTSGTGGSLTGITDTQGKSYTVDTSTKITAVTTHHTEIGVECGYSTQNSTAAADTVTCNVGGSITGSVCNAFEIQGSSTPPVLDQQNTNSCISSCGTGLLNFAGSITPSNAGTFAAVSAYEDDGSGAGGVFTAGSGWTLVVNAGGGNDDWFTEYQNIAGSSAVTGNASTTRNPVAGYVGAIISFK